MYILVRLQWDKRELTKLAKLLSPCGLSPQVVVDGIISPAGVHTFLACDNINYKPGLHVHL